MEKKYAIITFNKNHFLITEEENERLKSIRLDTFFKADDGSRIKGSDISEVLPMSKYYESYPEKRPVFVDKFKEVPGWGMEKTVKYSKGEALKGIIKGLKRYIASTPENPIIKDGKKYCYQGTDAPHELLKIMEKRLAQRNE